MIKVLFYGSGAIAREVYDFHISNATADLNWHFVGYVNDMGPDVKFEAMTDLKYCGRFSDIEDPEAYEYLVCVADPKTRASLIEKILQKKFRLFSYKHPTALISNSASIAEGCILYPFVVVSANAILERCVIVNTYTGIGHDVRIGSCTTLSAHVDLTGGVQVGENCFFGSGARVVPNKRIGNNASVGAGVTVIRSIKEKHSVLPIANKIIEF
jgi:sugar O-acyltransferase (sialic acid O-acetyltransferase NeuD family)